MAKTALRFLDFAIIDQVMKMNQETKEKFSTGLKLIIDKGMEPETAMEESGFTEAFKEDCAKQNKAPEPPTRDDPGT